MVEQAAQHLHQSWGHPRRVPKHSHQLVRLMTSLVKPQKYGFEAVGSCWHLTSAGHWLSKTPSAHTEGSEDNTS